MNVTNAEPRFALRPRRAIGWYYRVGAAALAGVFLPLAAAETVAPQAAKPEPETPTVKPAAAAAPAAPAAPVKKPLDKATLGLVKQLLEAQKEVYNNRSPRLAANYFKGQWAIMQLIPEFAERTPAVRAQLAESDKDVAAFLKQNDAQIKGMHSLMAAFQQQLGLDGVNIVVPRRMTATNPIPTKVVSTDITLTEDSANKKPEDVSRTLTDRDRKMIADFENYMKRLAYYTNKKDYANSERDWQGCADCYQGAYFFMLLVQQDPRYAIAYPETYKYLKTIKAGKVVIEKEGAEAPAKASAKAPAAAAEPAPAPVAMPVAVPVAGAGQAPEVAQAPSVGEAAPTADKDARKSREKTADVKK